MRHLRALLYDDKSIKHWSSKLPIVQRILNASVHESIGVAPAQLVLNPTITLDRNMYLPITALNVTERQLSHWADRSIHLQHKILEQAQALQKAKDLANIKARAERTKRKWSVDDLKIGQYVLAEYPESGMGHRAPNKLMAPVRGPYEIMAIERTSCLLRDLVTDRLNKVKVQLLKPYNHDPLRQNPLDAAIHDREEFYVDSIIKHRGSWNKRKELEFLVQWKGYDPSHNSWEPWSELRDNAILHTYLVMQGAEKLIPAKFRL